MSIIDKEIIKTLIEWRYDFHQYPEFGFEENRTAGLVAERLKSFGIETIEGMGKTGVIGILSKGSSDRSIGFRADMDALKINEANEFSHRSKNQGLMHACGHDGHTTMLLGAASHLAANGVFDGTIYFIFQPAEEHGAGATAMIDDGLFTRYKIDAIYGLHNLPGLPENHFAIRNGSIMASESGFEIKLRGKGGHAALPHMGKDTLLLGAQIVVALQSIVSRKTNALHQPAVVSVTEFITDGTVNVIPSEVVLKGDCRCFSDVSLDLIERSMRQIVEGHCLAAGAEFEFYFQTSFPSTINHPEPTAAAVRAAQQTFGDDQVNADCDPFTISEDFANMLRVRPGCYGLLGNGGDPASGCALHNPKYDFNNNLLIKGATYWINLVENELSVENA